MLNNLVINAQLIPQTIGSKNTAVKSLGNFSADSSLGLPKREISPGRYRDTGSVYYKIQDSTVFVWTGNAWRKIGGGESIAKSSQTANGEYIQNWNNHWLYVNSLKGLNLNSNAVDPNHPDNRKLFKLYSDSTIDGDVLQWMWGLKNINDDNTDSLHFKFNSTKNLTYLYQHVDGGAKMIEMDWDPFSFYPSAKIYANGNGKNGYYELGASVASIEPNDSTRVKLVSTPGATKMVTARAESGGVHTLGVADIVGVSDGDKTDITVSGSGATWAIDNNVVSDAKLRQSAGLSVIGRSANSSGNVADMTAGSDNQVLRRSGTTLGFGSLQTQHSISGNGIGSPFQLTNDASAPGSNKVYGTNASGVKGYQSTTVVNLSSPTNGQILVYQDGEWVNVDNNPVIPESQTTFKVGVSGMAAGDSVYTDASLEGKMVKVYREGERMFIDTIYGIEVDTSTGTITFHPYMVAGEKIIIEAGNYSTSTPVITLEDLDFPTQTNLTHTGTTWSATNATSIYNGYGLSNKRLASGEDGYIRARYTASDGSAAIIAFNTSNTSQKYADNPASPTVYHYEAGAFVFSGALYRLDNNTAAASVGGISVGDYWRIIRTGSTLKLQTSPDASVWTDRYTYTFSSTADLYINANIDANTGANKLYEPKGYNVE